MKKGVIPAAHVYALYREIPPSAVGRVRGPCADAGIFFRGDSGPSDIKKTLTTFLVLNIFYRSPKVTFKETYPFPRFQKRSNIFQGGGAHFFQRGGGVVSDCLFSIETHITCDFPISPSESAHEGTSIRGLK